MRIDRSVPQYARPNDSDALEQAIAVLGNRVKTAILPRLRLIPNSTTTAIVEATGIQRSSITSRLSELEQEDLIIADPPRSTRQRGEWTVYRVNDARVTELYLRLGQEIAEL